MVVLCPRPEPGQCRKWPERLASLQSAGVLESVFRGKQHSFLEDGSEEMIVRALLLGEPRRGDRYKRESRPRPNVPNGFPESCRRLQLSLRSVCHDAQIHIAGRARLATRVGTEQIDCPHCRDSANGLQALGQRFALAPQTSRQVVQPQLHRRQRKALSFYSQASRSLSADCSAITAFVLCPVSAPTSIPVGGPA